MLAILALKLSALAKQRLAQTLSFDERQFLVTAMVQDVLQALQNSRSIDHIVLLAPKPLPENIMKTYQIELLPEPTLCNDLNHAYQFAHAVLNKKKIQAALFLHGDLPRLQAKDIDLAYQQHQHFLKNQLHKKTLTLLANHEGTGTNAFIMNQCQDMNFCFGPDSLIRFQQMAKKHNISHQHLAIDGFSHDIDTKIDLKNFRSWTQTSQKQHNNHTSDYIHQQLSNKI